MNVLGAILRAARERHGLSLCAAARRVGVSHAFLSQMEAGRRCPALPTFARLVVVLNLEPEVGLLLRMLARPTQSA